MKVIESYKEIYREKWMAEIRLNNKKWRYPYHVMPDWLKENCEPSSFKLIISNNISRVFVIFSKEEDVNLLRLSKSHEFDINVTYFKDLVEILETYVDEP